MMKGGEGATNYIAQELEPKIRDIANIYRSVIDAAISSTHSNPFKFSFYGHRDFYAFIAYLKFRLQTENHIDLSDDMVLNEGIMRNLLV